MVPYYYVNIQNHLGIYVDHSINIIATLLYFTSNLTYPVTFLCFRCCFQTAFLDLFSQNDCFEASDDDSNNLKRHGFRKRNSPAGLTLNTDISSGIM